MDKPKHKRMLTMSSKNFMFECQSQIKRKITIFEDSICSEQDVSEMPTHQIRFDDGIFFLITLITTIFNHGSQLDPHQLVNILLPFKKIQILILLVGNAPYNPGKPINPYC